MTCRCPAHHRLVALLVLAAAFMGSMTLALVWHNPTEHHTFVALCRLAWSEVWEHGGTWRVLVPGLTLLAAVANGLGALVAQATATRQLGQRLASLPPTASPRVTLLAERLAMGERLTLLHSDMAFVFCYGLRTPRVYLSSRLVDMLDDDELEAVLLHEHRHLQCRDPLNVFVSRTLAKALVFLPVAGQFCASFLVARELEADHHAIQAQGGVGPLASALLKLSRYQSTLPLDYAAVSALSVTRERVRQLLQPDAVPLPGPSRRASLASALIVAILFVTSYAPLLASHEETLLHSDCSAPTYTDWHPTSGALHASGH